MSEATEEDSWRSGWAAWAVSTAAVAVLGTVALLVATTVVPALAGWSADAVVSGSMQPVLQVGDVVLARPAAADELRPGDVLVVADPDRPGAHRVHRLVGQDAAGLRLRGDANPAPDSSPVPPEDVLGVAVVRLPLVGWPLVWARAGAVGPLAGLAVAVAGLLALAGVHRDGGRPRATPVPPLVAAAAGCLLVVASTSAGGTAQAAFTAQTTSSAPWAVTWSTCDGAARAAGATHYWAMQEPTTFLFPQTAVNRGTAGAAGDGLFSLAQTLAQPGPACGGGDTRSAAFNTGLVSGVLPTQAMSTAPGQPAPGDLTVQVRVRTAGPGALVGFSDRLALYVDTAGRPALGVDDGARHGLTGSAVVADGVWHLVTATVGAGGAALYLDGVLVGTDPTITGVRPGSGSWRVGDGLLWGWPGAPLDGHLSGWLAHAAVFPAALTAAGVGQQASAGAW
ncbi:signal peptidase I [Klenkia sp. PcliD-1-E]|uniref:signal peptidase I n=1 Tax=Klenkia sp. PcliD-1-E TaxID=2954492 RepID=UPI00209820D9|nr:signal peptidase I [Klenkia sp. PcliD-1-E]MCO7220800.1 signal peptidase I [Klenkia sp. PcliD-1-E]